MSYKNLFIDSIKNNNIQIIYIIDPVKSSNIYDYASKDCFIEKQITKIMSSYELKNCKEINN